MNEIALGWAPQIENDLILLPCTLYRGGTSKGPVFLASDLPPDPVLRNRVILAALDAPSSRQIDGIGGSETHSSKVVVVSKSDRAGADVDYKFLQFYPGSSHVGEGEGTCGNMSTVVGPFALEAGLVEPKAGESTVRIFAVDSNMLMRARVQTPRGRVSYGGDACMAGVDGTAGPMELSYVPPYGNFTGSLLPSGRRRDLVDGVPVTIVDAGGGIAVVFPATAVGRTGYESKEELDADDRLVERLEPIIAAATRTAGLETSAGRAIVKPIMVARATQGGSIAARDLNTLPQSRHNCHPAHSGSGAVQLAIACKLKGTVPFDLSEGRRDENSSLVMIEHPAGAMEVRVDRPDESDDISISGVSLIRTCRKLFYGQLCVPLSVLGQAAGAIGRSPSPSSHL